jgi:hypothetical protein
MNHRLGRLAAEAIMLELPAGAIVGVGNTA